jgi:hypothetical protein
MLTVEEIAQAVSKLTPEEFARFRTWFKEFDATGADKPFDLETTATRLGRLAGRTFAELRKRTTPKD